jgi:hypothetical protein
MVQGLDESRNVSHYLDENAGQAARIASWKRIRIVLLES